MVQAFRQLALVAGKIWPKTMKHIFYLAIAPIVVCGVIAASACRRQPQSRQYEENGSAAASTPEQPPAPPQAGTWHWEKPSQWLEQGGNGLRLMTFSIADRDAPSQCAIIPLPGDGGGVQANVQRWLEQLRLPQISSAELANFLGRQKTMQTKGGLPVLIVDFTTLGPRRERSEASMLVAIITGGDQTLFVKWNGGKALLEKNREVFLAFCRSLRKGA